jgi:hypothetical protein
VSEPGFRVEGGVFSSLSVGVSLHAGVCVLDESAIPRCWAVPNERGERCVAPSAEPARQVVAGSNGICVVSASGAVECTEAYPVTGSVPPVLAGSFTHIDHDGTLICGIGAEGAACSGDLTCGPHIPEMEGLTDVNLDWGFPGYACALDAAGTYLCWGNYPESGCGESGEVDCVCSPLDEPYSAGPYTQVAHGVCGLRPDGTIDCPLSFAIPPSGEFSTIGGRYFPAAIRTDGVVVYWATVGVDPTALETPDGTFIAVETDRDLTCGLYADGGLECWGLRVDEFVACE